MRAFFCKGILVFIKNVLMRIPVCCVVTGQAAQTPPWKVGNLSMLNRHGILKVLPQTMTSHPTNARFPTPSSKSDARAFVTTRWTLVQRAKSESQEGRRALEELCSSYYQPVVTFFQCALREPDAGRDAAHDFFSRMLAGNAIGQADRERGRFRSYLLGSAKHFLANRHEAGARIKRGGGVQHLSLSPTDSGLVNVIPDMSVLTPEEAYDRQWALTVVARAVEAIREECASEGRSEFFEQVKPWLTGDADHGDQAELAQQFGMNSNALKVAVHRLKRRFRQLLKEEIAGTLEDPSLVETEMRALFAALGGQKIR